MQVTRAENESRGAQLKELQEAVASEREAAAASVVHLEKQIAVRPPGPQTNMLRPGVLHELVR